MFSGKVRNLYIPNQSNRFSITNNSKFGLQNLSQINNQDKVMSDCTVPVSITDACRINNEYSELIQEWAIDNYSNDEDLKMIQ